MTLHDAYARVTPYELSFPDLDWARERFPGIREEARARRVDAADPGRFILLAAVGQMLRDLRPLEEEAELIHSHGALLYHAFHFWEQGEPLFLADVQAARWVVEADWVAERMRIPSSAGYLQLPQHLFWTGGGEDEAPESVDGFFWVAVDSRSNDDPRPGDERAGDDPNRSEPGWDEPRDRIHVLLVAGMRTGRPGFSVIPIPPVSGDTLAAWGEASVRDPRFARVPRGIDFGSELPGSSLGGLHQLTSPGEALKLAARLWSLSAEEAVPETVAPEGTSPSPSRLPFRRITVR